MDKMEVPVMDGKKLESLIGDRGKRLERFASQIGMSVTGAKKWLGGTQPKVGYFINIARYFGLSLDAMAAELGLIDEPPPSAGLPPEVATAIRRALISGVPASILVQSLEFAMTAFEASRETTAATRHQPQRGREAL